MLTMVNGGRSNRKECSVAKHHFAFLEPSAVRLIELKTNQNIVLINNRV